MTDFRTLPIVFLGAMTLLASAPAQALDPRIFYQGNAAASDRGPNAAPPQSAGATTAGPATYQAVSGANAAVSTTDAGSGGSAYSSASATSAVRSDGFLWAGGSGAQSTVAYYAYLIGSSGPVRPAVPVRVEAAGYVDGVSFAQGTASLVIQYYDGGSSAVRLTAVAQIYVDGSGTRTFDVDQVINILPNTEIAVTLSTNVGASGPTTGAGSSWATAYVDPKFTIDPAYAADYHFEGIPGVSAVPEPTRAALLLPGLLAIAAIRRRGAKA